MAALGKLVANFAHEINTPLGALKASVENNLAAMNKSSELLPELFRILSKEQVEMFSELLKTPVDNQERLTSQEKRKVRKVVSGKLKAHSIDQASLIADRLVDIGIYENLDRFIPLLDDNNRMSIINSAYNLSSQKRNYAIMNLAIERMSRTVFALMAYSRGDDQEPMIKADITEGMKTVLTLYQSYLNRGIHLDTHFQPVPEVNCYPHEIAQVWSNLILNSIHSMVNEGTLTVSICQEDEHIVVQVKDNGPGIPDTIKPKIFQPFFTTKAMGEGSGLGLDIVHRIIEKHKGKIEFQSKPKETIFTVRLPINN